MELRDRLIKTFLAVGIAGVALALWPGPGALYDMLAAPLVAHLPEGAHLIATSVISPFLVPLKILLMSAFLIALPVVLYQAWAFVAPGLYSHEKRLVLPLVVSSTVLFIVGAFIIAAVVTPPDVVSQLALAIPMCLLYEVGIWAAQLFIRHTQAPDAEPAQGGEQP